MIEGSRTVFFYLKAMVVKKYDQLNDQVAKFRSPHRDNGQANRLSAHFIM
jgi:hypothetical protein